MDFSVPACSSVVSVFRCFSIFFISLLVDPFILAGTALVVSLEGATLKAHNQANGNKSGFLLSMATISPLVLRFALSVFLSDSHFHLWNLRFAFDAAVGRCGSIRPLEW